MPGVLATGPSTFVFTLTVTDPDPVGGVSTASVVVQVNSPPSDGVFTVSSNNGTAMTDVFVVNNLGWKDAHNPLSYSYYYHP